MSGLLKKLKILAYLDCDFAIPAGVYFAQINPASYTLNYNLIYTSEQKPGSSSKNATVNIKKPETLTFDFVFDGTGVVKNEFSTQSFLGERGVETDLKLFKEFLIDFHGDTHRPKYLVIQFGTLLFHCVATSLNIEYKLFNNAGAPIRAIAKVAFKKSESEILRKAKEKFSSSDLTHVRTVKSHDTLYNLCQEIYSDGSLYLKVAEINNLINFRNIQTGIKVYFPPLKEISL